MEAPVPLASSANGITAGADGVGADGIEVGPGNQLYVTMYNSGDVIRIDPAASSGFNTKMVASGLTNPYGMAMGADGALYVASQDARLLRIAPDGSQRFIALPTGFAAFQVARAGNDIWATDANNARAIRIRNAGLPEPQPPVTTPPVTTPPVAPPPVTTPPATTKPAAKPKVAFKVKLAVKLTDGTTLTETRTYKTCAPKKKR